MEFPSELEDVTNQAHLYICHVNEAKVKIVVSGMLFSEKSCLIGNSSLQLEYGKMRVIRQHGLS